MRRTEPLLALICTILTLTSYCVLADPLSTSEKGAQIHINTPLNGATVSGPIRIVIDSRMIMMMPEGVPHSGSGHIHLIVNPVGAPKPGDSLLSSSKHFSFQQGIDLKKGERETSILLPAGNYQLQAVLGDHKHRAHQPPVVSELISITVPPQKPSQKSTKKATQ